MKGLGNILLVVFIALLQTGAIRRDDDPIANTQTNPIAYKDKMEETKDGEKAAPTPFFRNYQKESFLIDPPVTNEPVPDSAQGGELPYVPKLGEPIPELKPDTSKEEKEWWFDDKKESSVQETEAQDVSPK